MKIKSLKNSQEDLDRGSLGCLLDSCCGHLPCVCLSTLLCTPAPFWDSWHLNELPPTPAALFSSMAPPFGREISELSCHTTAHTPKLPFSWLPIPFHRNFRLPSMHAKLGNVPPQASSFSDRAVLPRHLLPLHPHLCILSHDQAVSLSYCIVCLKYS